MKRASFIVVIFALLLSCELDAYEIMKSQSGDELYWRRSDMPLKWYLNKNGCPDLPFEDVQIALESSFNTWQRIDCSYTAFGYAGTREEDAFGPDAHNTPDFKNTISWVESDWPDEWTEAYAVTIPAYDISNGRIVDADMEFNADWFTWEILSEASSENPDVQNIATHEIGHFIGLDHSDTGEATLFPYGVPGELHKRTLAEDDILGLCSHYPIEGADGWPCNNDGDCSDGRKCLQNPDTASRLCSSSCYCDQDCSGSLECSDGWCLPVKHEIGRTMGDPCSLSLPCISSLICLEDICSDYCVSNKQCPENWDCVPISSGGRACYGESSNTDGDGNFLSIESFEAELESPQFAGTKIRLTAALNEEGQCRFIARHSSGNYTTIKTYSDSCRTTWLPTEIGSYELFAEARSSTSEACYDVRKTLFYTIISEGEPGGAGEDGDTASGGGTGDDDNGCNSTGTGTITTYLLAAILLILRRRHD